MFGKTKQLATNLMQAASGMTPEQFCRAAGEVAGKTIIDIGSAGVLGKLSGTSELFTAIGSVKKGLQTAADIAKGKKVEQLTQTFSRKTLKRAAALVEQQPLLFEEGCPAVDMVQKAAAAITRAEELARTLGKNITPEVLLTLEKLPAESLSKKVFEEFWLKDKMPTVNWRHIFVGEMKKKKGLTGFHYKRSYPDMVEKILEGPNKFGIVRAKIKGKYSYSDLFPAEWNRAKIGEKIKEAYNNIIETGQQGFIGKTSEGINIQFWVSEVTGPLSIKNAYPIFK